MCASGSRPDPPLVNDDNGLFRTLRGAADDYGCPLGCPQGAGCSHPDSSFGRMCWGTWRVGGSDEGMRSFNPRGALLRWRAD